MRLGKRDWEESEEETANKRLGRRDWEEKNGKKRLGGRDWEEETGKKRAGRRDWEEEQLEKTKSLGGITGRLAENRICSSVCFQNSDANGPCFVKATKCVSTGHQCLCMHKTSTPSV